MIGSGRGSSSASEVSHAILWNKGKLTDLGNLGGASAYTTGINARGQVSGNGSNTWREHSTNRAFLWDKGVLTDLGTLGGEYTSTSAINRHPS
ncbi:hypothetical protein AADEFJLK_04359 [Methylovulum psychrotolerans]|uniref:Uncharacterized protein n=1 Tax=Methylovulum psychrotolerans TaxID=1704499 RepID=A0A2S5CGB4_9GAMM|nr:hypothetical protein AADEFJLK_04359 [Methylovulum psychrotolerans]